MAVPKDGRRLSVSNQKEQEGDDPLELSFWDHGGQREYEPTNTLYINRRTLEILCFDAAAVLDLPQETRIDALSQFIQRWMEAIKAHVDAPHIVVLANKGAFRSRWKKEGATTDGRGCKSNDGMPRQQKQFWAGPRSEGQMDLDGVDRQPSLSTLKFKSAEKSLDKSTNVSNEGKGAKGGQQVGINPIERCFADDEEGEDQSQEENSEEIQQSLPSISQVYFIDATDNTNIQCLMDSIFLYTRRTPAFHFVGEQIPSYFALFRQAARDERQHRTGTKAPQLLSMFPSNPETATAPAERTLFYLWNKAIDLIEGDLKKNQIEDG
uniref:Uncharacterized protein n=1 Tax=Chromera velia CCMP2878 TaxID=1169474 RepID=A0A0G4IEH4_9ALVE|eukprot:Cvel_13685.t1-p1 / transcript=Cvel_13685.t1 / gene=Cvel_13685 / organism=Chromera_velia_CCMP2878 / gene_product=hypothetical protein / transcript_product=hypothetical protein / location=Cvel_scaffold945:39161-40370(-) / protein_length=322 / sequence_SO=supercontig / SO=protein_coding / is_pseudo=false